MLPRVVRHQVNLLLTGGCGFLGANLAADALAHGDALCVLDNLSRTGSEQNLAWLRSQGDFRFERADIRDANVVEQLVRDFRPATVFHLAAQVAMTTSIADPRADFETNALGTLNVLEAVRKHAPAAAVIYSSTNKVYGDLEWVRYEETETRYVAPDYPNGFDESLALDFASPYGCSKGAADQYMLDYARTYDLRTVVFRHSSMYGGRQFATHDQGWVGWFCGQALAQQGGTLREPFTIAGTGKQVRDVLHADDMKRLYRAALAHIDRAKGRAFNIGGGMSSSLSLLELFGLIEELLAARPRFERLPPRHSDQKVFVADTRRAAELLDWRPQVSAREGIAATLAWLRR